MAARTTSIRWKAILAGVQTKTNHRKNNHHANQTELYRTAAGGGSRRGRDRGRTVGRRRRSAVLQRVRLGKHLPVARQCPAQRLPSPCWFRSLRRRRVSDGRPRPSPQRRLSRRRRRSWRWPRSIDLPPNENPDSACGCRGFLVGRALTLRQSTPNGKTADGAPKARVTAYDYKATWSDAARSSSR